MVLAGMLLGLTALLPAPGGAGSPRPAAPKPLVKAYLPMVSRNSRDLFILLGESNVEQRLYLDEGGDVDTEVVWVGGGPTEARRTGNGAALPAPDGNQIPDYYLQLLADDAAIYAGEPTTRLRVEVEYWDEGTDTFLIQYDALAGGPFGDGRFKNTYQVTKTGTETFQTAVFYLCDAYFANRDNGADLRIDDRGDGAETLRRVMITLLYRGPATVPVDSCGANPWDSQPDSDAIQECIVQACDGDTVLFTSGRNSPGYRGYQVDKTLFLVPFSARRNITFTSTDPANHALLKATAALDGFVMRLFPRSRWPSPGEIDDITVSHLDLDGGRGVRRCFGDDGIENGVDDNWGSWLPECSQPGDPWCRAGTLAMEGVMNANDPAQDYQGEPWVWSTGLVVDNVTSANTECGTALALAGAAGTITGCTIDSAGDHVHVSGCTQIDPDEGTGGWSDGITFVGPSHTVSGNTITDASDVGIVFFGGRDTIVAGNTVSISPGNHGMFAGIALHGWIFGDVSGVQVIGNQVVSEGDSACGGTHAGINLGTHMWGAGCVTSAYDTTVGNAAQCLVEPPPPAGALCSEGQPCQVWTHVAAGSSLKLQDNYVAGAQVNYLVEGLDLVGSLVQSGNTSGAPHMSDWESAKAGCPNDGGLDTWGTIDRAAHHPSLSGWTDQRVHCER